MFLDSISPVCCSLHVHLDLTGSVSGSPSLLGWWIKKLSFAGIVLRSTVAKLRIFGEVIVRNSA
jgi:hypothetical protein